MPHYKLDFGLVSVQSTDVRMGPGGEQSVPFTLECDCDSIEDLQANVQSLFSSGTQPVTASLAVVPYEAE